MDDIFVIKRNGERELWNPDKIHSHLSRACSGLDVDVVSIIKGARLKIFDGVNTADIQTALIKSAQEKISQDACDYEIAAGRLLNQAIRKEVYGHFTPDDFVDSVTTRINKGWYTADLKLYSRAELRYFESLLRYDLDDNMKYSSLERLYKSYLIKVDGKLIETPQEAFILIPMTIFAHCDPEYRKKYVELGYKLLSTSKISLPTPIMNGARSPFKHYISCNLIDFGDSVKSLSHGTRAIMECTASKSGLGINASSIRGIGGRIGNPVRVTHTGILPIIKTIEAATGSLTQVGRQGSCNITLPWFHKEIELFAQLGDSKGSLENRARHTDQTIIINKWFLEKALANEDVYIFNINEVTNEQLKDDLYDALGDYHRFEALYQTAVNTVPNEYKKRVPALDLLKLFIAERMITGRVYFTFADNSRRGSFKENLYFTNLCCEILVPSKPMDGFRGTPEIGCCILGNINLGFIKDNEIADAADFLVNFLDTMIDNSDYANDEVKYAAVNRRTLGIGISNLFGWLASSHVFYNTKATRKQLHDTMESIYWHLLDASCKLAESKGPASLFDDTKYSEGVFSFDQFESPETFELTMPWDELRARIRKYGLRNSSLMAVPPAASSSAVSGATAGVEPPRELVTIKVDKFGSTKQLVPFFKDKNWYTTAWGDDFNNLDYIKLISVVQKFVDQSISTNLYYNTLKANGKVQIADVLEEMLTSFKYGIKTWYYANFRTTDDEDGIKQPSCEGGCQV